MTPKFPSQNSILFFQQALGGGTCERLVSQPLFLLVSFFDMITKPICQSPETRVSLEMMFQNMF
jgi:hypothetical protein